MTACGAVELMRKAVLSLVALAAFGSLLAIGPYLDHAGAQGARQQSAAIQAAPLLPPLTPPPPARSTMVVAGLPFATEQRRIAPCDPRRWHPADAGLCSPPCQLLHAAKSASSATFVWAAGGDPGAGGAPPALHTVIVRCSADESQGDLLHLWTSGGVPGAPGAPAPAAAAPRGEPIPLLPGASEIARWRAPGWSIAVDRPRLAATALEELALALNERGWRPAPAHLAADLPEAPEARVFLRGAELCIATLQLEGDEAHLITAYSPGGWATETPR